MATAVHGVIIFLSVVAIVLGIAALATDEWMSACIDMSDVMKAAGASEQLPSGFSLSGMTMCMGIGVMEVGMNMANLAKVSVALSFSGKEAALHITAGFLIIAFILLIAAVVCIGRSSCARSYSKTLSMQRAKAGSALNISAGCLMLLALIVYTATQASTIHNPMKFMATWGLGIAGSSQFQSVFSQFGGMSGMPHGAGIPDMSSFNPSSDSSNPMPGMPDMSSFNPSSDSSNPGMAGSDISNGFGGLLPSGTNGQSFPTDWPLGGGNSGGSRKRRQIPGMGGADAAEMMKIFNNMDPMFGYSFYLGWVSAAFALIAGILGMVMVARQRPGEDFDRVPLA